ncbi:MAG: hypothetical protein E4H02_07015 [Lentisphaerales bacterium]|nr:MAG: hypothetical protein E4H02_07015 [Lentisphaerales bacterium]
MDAGILVHLGSDDILLDATSSRDMSWDADATNTVASWTNRNAVPGILTAALLSARQHARHLREIRGQAL